MTRFEIVLTGFNAAIIQLLIILVCTAIISKTIACFLRSHQINRTKKHTDEN